MGQRGLGDTGPLGQLGQREPGPGPLPLQRTGDPLHRKPELASAGAVVLLVALLATGALTEHGGFAGWARPAGVLVGGVLAWRKAPFVVVVVGAAAVTALLRATGVT
ncbi:AzlD domain-containing protein [Streptomyces sp. NPDC054770]